MFSTGFWILVSLQILLGAFDTIFHHELTERLAWRQSQRHEVRLHGVRNLFYAVLFFGLAFFTVGGVAAWIVIGILVMELVITLVDFVEEDRTRKLPASERITHTLLALNYGAILVFLMPVLWAWTHQPTGIGIELRGGWSVLMVLAALGVGVFGVRDLIAADRLKRLRRNPAKALVDPGLPPQAILVTGGTGFVGRRLVQGLVAGGHDVTVLTRRPEVAATLASPLRVITSLNHIGNGDRIDAIIHLAGQSVVGWLWTKAYRRKIIESRVVMTKQLLALVKRLSVKPTTFIGASAIGIYGADAGPQTLEDAPVQEDGSFAQTSCQACEGAALAMEQFGVRTVMLRIGMVLDPDGGALGQMLFPFEFGLGGPFGDGAHWMSWITRDDLVRLIVHTLQDASVDGPVNATAPHPITNGDFAAALGTALGRPTVLALPRWVLTGVLGDLAREIFLGNQYVFPEKATRMGFVFDAPDMEAAFLNMFGLRPKRINRRAKTKNVAGGHAALEKLH